MLQTAIDRYPEEDWYGFCGSDCVPVRNLLEGLTDHEALIYHRTDIPEWKFRFNITDGQKELSKEVFDQIHEWHRDGVSDKKIARRLNRAGAPPPSGHEEWTVPLLYKLFFEKGIVYFWGQDMFLFRQDVMGKVMEHVEKQNPIVGTGGFDQRLTKWCIESLQFKRVTNRIVHKTHTSEWNSEEVEYKHNGGEVTDKERSEYINDTLLLGFNSNRDNWVPHIVVNPLSFIKTERLIEATNMLASFLPCDVDAIFGIARSGLIPASVLACYLHLPIFTVSEKGVMDCGTGVRFQKVVTNPRKILLVDDTIFAGRTMQRILPVVRDAFPRATVVKAAIYATPQAKHLVDHFVCELAEPHYLEWNLFNAGPGERAIYDMDGILCHDIAAENEDDGIRYIRALKNAMPKHLPRRREIHMIATARLERYREITMEWLEKHQVRTGKLVMGPWQTLAERNKPNTVATFKSSVYNKSDQELFIESCPIQAKEICRQTGKRVLCPAAERVFA
jgi:adenine/guanine phosphoribosyltransferase-like PRPP-binding protein